MILRFGAASDDGLSALGKPFPLAGVRILDFSWFLASAGATRFLAALGADVLKVEWKTHPDSGRGSLVPEGGRAAREGATSPVPALKDPGIGGQYNNKNPGKRGLSLNVADPRGLEIAQALLAKCDVVAEGFSPGVLERWGLGYAEQRKIRPDVIYVKQSGMGAFGTYGRFRAVGPIAAALSGMSEMSGLPSPAPPAGWGYSFLDWFGAYSMALSVLAALYHRDLTGEGQWIDASQTEAGIMLTQVPVLDWARQRAGLGAERQPFAVPVDRAAGHLPVRGRRPVDRDHLRVGGQWRALAHLAGHDDWLADPRFATAASRLAHHDALDAALDAWTRSFEPYELMMRLQSAGRPGRRLPDRRGPVRQRPAAAPPGLADRADRNPDRPLAAGRGPGPDVTHAALPGRPPGPGRAAVRRGQRRHPHRAARHVRRRGGRAHRAGRFVALPSPPAGRPEPAALRARTTRRSSPGCSSWPFVVRGAPARSGKVFMFPGAIGAAWERVSLTRRRSQVQILYRPPRGPLPKATRQGPFCLSRTGIDAGRREGRSEAHDYDHLSSRFDPARLPPAAGV